MSNLNLNKVVLGGRLTADPELKTTAGGKSVTTVSLAVTRSRADAAGNRQTDFITLVAWNKTAEFISKYFRKGSALCVTGSIQTRTWDDQNGQKRYATEVIVDEAMFVDGKNGDAGSANSTPTQDEGAPMPPSYNANAADTPNYEEMSGEDDDLPF